MMTSDGQQSAIFITINQMSQETGLPRNQIIKDIKLGKLPAFKRGKSYYIYSTDASKYIFNLVCIARGLDPKRYNFMAGIEVAQIQDTIEKGLGINDKSKN